MGIKTNICVLFKMYLEPKDSPFMTIQLCLKKIPGAFLRIQPEEFSSKKQVKLHIKRNNVNPGHNNTPTWKEKAK